MQLIEILNAAADQVEIIAATHDGDEIHIATIKNPDCILENISFEDFLSDDLLMAYVYSVRRAESGICVTVSFNEKMFFERG